MIESVEVETPTLDDVFAAVTGSHLEGAERGVSAREGRVVLALGRRALSVQFRRAQLLMPTFVLPLMLLAVIASGTSAAQDLRGFPDVASYLAFVVPGHDHPGRAARRADERHRARGRHRVRLLRPAAGRAGAPDQPGDRAPGGDARPVGAAVVVLPRRRVRCSARATQAGAGAILATIGLAAITAVGIGGIASAIALRTGSLSLLQSIFPFVFVLLFTAPAFFPRDLLAPALRDVAAYNPLTYVVEAVRGMLTGDDSLGDPLRRPRRGGAARGRDHRAGDARAGGAPAHGCDRAVALHALAPLAQRGAARARRAAARDDRAVVFLLGMTGQFGRLTGLDGFPTDSYLSWIVPLSCLQGAGFAGAATGSNLARDIEQGWFDRLLVAPVPRPLLLSGRSSAASRARSCPATVVLLVGLALGAELTGGVPG